MISTLEISNNASSILTFKLLVYFLKDNVVYIHIYFKTIWFRVLPLGFYKKPMYTFVLVNVKVPQSQVLHVNLQTKS